VKIPEGEYSRKAGFGRILNPNLTASVVYISLSTIMGFGVFLQILFYHPVINVYYSNIFAMFSLYLFGTGSMPASLPQLGLYLGLTIGILVLIVLMPFIVRRVNKIQFKSPKIRPLLILGLVFIPFWFIFYQPLIMGPPQILLSTETHIREINGVAVPFQGDTVYPSFEWQSAETRQYLNLSGEWKVQKGERSSPYTLSPRDEAILNLLTQGQHLKDYDDSGWSTNFLPSAISQYEDKEHHWGTIWYRKVVSIPAGFADKYLLLKFLGANYITDVWIDGHYLGFHEGGFTPFVFDVSAICTPGDHVFAIRVDNPEWDVDFVDKTVPDHGDFFNYGGIVREFYVEAAPLASIQRLDVRMGDFTSTNHLNGSAEIEINVVIKCPAVGILANPAATLNISIFPLLFLDNTSMMSRETWNYADLINPVMATHIETMDLVGMAGTDYLASKISLSLANVNYWSTKRPNLYAVMANLSWGGGQIDRFCTQTGFRNITVEGTKLLLNGAPLKLAGVSRHEQYPTPTGRTLSDFQHFLDLELINSTGSNWWRGSYPFHPITYIHSDRIGLACWEETPVFWQNEGDFIQGNTRNIFESYWIEMVFRDLNRPSIIFWGACNEPWAQGPLYEYLDQSKAFLDKYDPTRILSFACVSTHHWNQGYKNLRVCTPNTYGGTFDGVIGDYYGEIAKELDLFSSNNPGKPLVSMEWGMWRSGDDTEQRKCFEEGFKAFSEHETTVGMTWWLSFDYFGTNYYNSMGIFNMERNWHGPTFDIMLASYTEYTKGNL
jgi:beta-glucuronidase